MDDLLGAGGRFLTTGAKHTTVYRDLNATEEAKATLLLGEKFQMERSCMSEDIYVQLGGTPTPLTSESGVETAGFQGELCKACCMLACSQLSLVPNL